MLLFHPPASLALPDHHSLVFSFDFLFFARLAPACPPRMAIVRMSALALICASHALAQGNSTKWPEVVGVLAVPGSLVEHHTDKYDAAAMLLTGRCKFLGILLLFSGSLLLRTNLSATSWPQDQRD